MNITKQKNVPTSSGFIATKFFEAEEEKTLDFTQKDRVTLNMSFASLGSFDKPLEIVEVSGEPDNVTFKLFDYKECRLSVILEKLQRKTVDLVVSIDSCSLRKQTPTSVLMPKIIINQILIHQQPTEQQKFGQPKSQGLVIPES